MTDTTTTTTPVPERITAALDLRGLYGPEVDRACGVEEPTVDLWEQGALVPTPEQVALLAALTGFPVRFFYLPAPAPVAGWVCRGKGKRGTRCQYVEPEPRKVPDAVQLALF